MLLPRSLLTAATKSIEHAAGGAMIATGVAVGVCLLTYVPDAVLSADAGTSGGLVRLLAWYVADTLFASAGLGAFVLALYITHNGICSVLGQPAVRGLGGTLAWLLFFAAAAAGGDLFGWLWASESIGHRAGGVLGILIDGTLVAPLSEAGVPETTAAAALALSAVAAFFWDGLAGKTKSTEMPMRQPGATAPTQVRRSTPHPDLLAVLDQRHRVPVLSGRIGDGIGGIMDGLEEALSAVGEPHLVQITGDASARLLFETPASARKALAHLRRCRSRLRGMGRVPRISPGQNSESVEIDIQTSYAPTLLGVLEAPSVEGMVPLCLGCGANGNHVAMDLLRHGTLLLTGDGRTSRCDILRGAVGQILCRAETSDLRLFVSDETHDLSALGGRSRKGRTGKNEDAGLVGSVIDQRFHDAEVGKPPADTIVVIASLADTTDSLPWVDVAQQIRRYGRRARVCLIICAPPPQAAAVAAAAPARLLSRVSGAQADVLAGDEDVGVLAFTSDTVATLGEGAAHRVAPVLCSPQELRRLSILTSDFMLRRAHA